MQHSDNELSRFEDLIQSQREVLRMITRGAPLSGILDWIADWLERESGAGAIASILCLDASGRQVRHCAGSRLPAAYLVDIKQLFDRPEAAEGSAAFCRVHAVGGAIEESVLWKDHRQIALQHDLRASWSTYLLNGEGALQGSMTVYHRQASGPSAQELQLYELAAQTAVLAIDMGSHEAERKQFSEILAKKVEERTEALKEANSQLTAMNEELQQFAYVASHDLQEPLRKIRIFSGMLSSYVEKDGEAGTYLHKLTSSAERMSGLINSLLEYSRVANMQVRFEPVDLNALLQVILSDYELVIAQKEAIVHIGPLPVLQAIPLQMNQLFFNLLGNALKFTKRGEKPVILIRSEPLDTAKRADFPQLSSEKEYVMITVEDNGLGFDQEFATRIFTVFQRLNDLSNEGGYGIGLALCKKVADTHKGLIYAHGELKRGATFTIILPLHQ